MTVERVLGIPVGTFATALVVILAVAFSLIGVAAARNRSSCGWRSAT